MRSMLIAGVVLVAGALLVAPLVSQEGTDDPWAAAARPGKWHEQMAKVEGDWNCTMNFWMAPGGEPTAAKGTARFSRMMGGRFVRQDFVSKDIMGQPFEGEGVMGYDNGKKKFVSSWIDTMSTSILYSEGTASKDGKVLTFVGEMTDPTSGQPVKYRNVLTHVGPDETKFEMFYPSPTGQDDFRAMEIIYKRVPHGE